MIDPTVLAALITAIIQILLQLFGGDHAAVAHYLSGADIPWYKPVKKWARAAEIRGLVLAHWRGPAEQLEQANREVSAEFADATPGSVKTWGLPNP